MKTQAPIRSAPSHVNSSLPLKNHEDFGWIVIPYSREIEEHARAIRHRRDQRYGNVFSVLPNDRRHYGDLGEMTFIHWLRKNRVQDFTWNVASPSRNSDVTLHGREIDVKTCKSREEISQAFLVLCSDHTLDSSPANELFFCCCLYNDQKMLLLGGIPKDAFRKKATKQIPKAALQNGLTNRDRPMWTLPAYELEKPTEWLARQLRAK